MKNVIFLFTGESRTSPFYTFEHYNPPNCPIRQSGGAAKRHNTKCG